MYMVDCRLADLVHKLGGSVVSIRDYEISRAGWWSSLQARSVDRRSAELVWNGGGGSTLIFPFAGIIVSVRKVIVNVPVVPTV